MLTSEVIKRSTNISFQHHALRRVMACLTPEPETIVKIMNKVEFFQKYYLSHCLAPFQRSGLSSSNTEKRKQ